MSSAASLIVEELRQLEKDRVIKILYAAEAGSRAWGFPSADSDYDVRFIYVQGTKDLVKLYPSDDNFDINIKAGCFPDLDMAGWRLDKALKLMTKSNAALLEWIDSPIVYLDDDGFAADLFYLAYDFIDDRALVHHYANMAYRCVVDHLKMPMVKLKKYFYCIRPILAADYVIAGRGTPPVDFHELFNTSKVPENIHFKIKELLKRKELSSSESDRQAQDLELLDWIETSIRRLRTIATKMLPKAPTQRQLHDYLDQFYYEQVIKYDKRISGLE